jgi:ubiquinone/menaquinone biosynthesis C-methylase UbiE
LSDNHYNTIGAGYNSTRKADPEIADTMQALLECEVGKTYLDIGCGTGNYTSLLSERGFRFIGIDPSSYMLSQAKMRNDSIEWREGAAEGIPAADGEFDGAMATLTVHHWEDMHLGFKELRRVVKPGGRIVIFTSTPEQMRGYWLNHYFPNMMQASMLQMPTYLAIQTAARSAGIEFLGKQNYTVSTKLQDHFLYVGKHNPEVYFDESVRAGISSFALLANSGEVERGLTQLSDDIDRGQFWKFKQRYENRGGDYVFLVCG